MKMRPCLETLCDVSFAAESGDGDGGGVWSMVQLLRGCALW